MEANELMKARRSVGKLVEPAPEGPALERILSAALRAPDHGALRPWKILLVRGAGRDKLGEVLGGSAKRRKSDIAPDELAREKAKPLRAPLLAIVVAAVRPSGKIPEIEQILSAGCVAYGLEVAAQAEGFGAMWRTGEAVYDREVHTELGLGENDHIVGIVYVGTPREEPPAIERPKVGDFVSDWG